LMNFRIKGLTKSIGAGDLVAKFTKAIGITPCSACRKRQAALNNMMAFVPWRVTPFTGQLVIRKPQDDATDKKPEV